MSYYIGYAPVGISVSQTRPRTGFAATADALWQVRRPVNWLAPNNLRVMKALWKGQWVVVTS